jgi:transposase
MTPSPPLPEALWSRIPEEVREALSVVLQFYQTRIEHLEARVAELEARLQQNSANSHKPPSADPPHAKPAPKAKTGGHKPGGQPGHPKAERVRLEPDRVIDHKPAACHACGAPLAGDDASPRSHQVWELPEIKPEVTEHRFHTLACPCGHATPAPMPADIPTDGYGPRLKAAAVYLTGVPHLSKSQAEALFEDLLGIPISTGQVCALEAEAVELLAPVMTELKAALPRGDVSMDETSWKQSGKLCWLWVGVARLFSVFHIAFSRGRKVVEGLLGSDYAFVLTTDRWSAYHRVSRRQVCWAHLRRDFQALIDRGGAGRRVGEELLLISDLVFGLWQRIRDGTLTRRVAVQRIVAWFQPDFRVALESGAECDCARAAGLCRELLSRWDHLWRFCEEEGVEPTNNASERALRPAVLWRKKSQGTRSEVGSRYAATILSVAATCRQQGRRVWAYLTEVFNAGSRGEPAPSLLPAS